MAKPPQDPVPKKGLGFGIFLLVIGVTMLAQQAGWLPARLDWLFPAILIAWGASEIFQHRR